MCFYSTQFFVKQKNVITVIYCINCLLLQAYQLFKARAYGADAVLLIAAVLPNNDLEYLIAAAKKIGLQSLIEVSTTDC